MRAAKAHDRRFPGAIVSQVASQPAGAPLAYTALQVSHLLSREREDEQLPHHVASLPFDDVASAINCPTAVAGNATSASPSRIISGVAGAPPMS